MERIKSSQFIEILKTDSVVVKNVAHKYSNKQIAVDNLNFGIQKGKCFGLMVKIDYLLYL